jgi:hypothetical protein
MTLAEGRASEVAHTNDALARRVYEQITVLRMEVRASNHLRQLIHVLRLDIYHTERLILHSNVPQVNSQVVRRNECLTIYIPQTTLGHLGRTAVQERANKKT